jgi:hypothetical protein
MVKMMISSISELLSALPFVIGFHPEDSLVVVATDGTAMKFVFRIDLPEPGVAEAEARLPMLHLATLVVQHRPGEVTLIGYGDSSRVTPAMQHLSAALMRADVAIAEEILVTDGRYRSYSCDNLTCCPVEGRPCPPPDSVLAAEATFAGAVALPSRKDLETQLEPVSGEQRTAMAKAGERAMTRLIGLRADPQRSRPAAASQRSRRFERLVVRAGRKAVRDAERSCRTGGRLTDDEVAWLAILLRHRRVRDYAWTRSGTERWHLDLWSGVVRRVDPAHVVAPASLLAFAAWRAGHGALASIAVERALEADPGYRMAVTMKGLLYSAVPSSVVDGWPAVPGMDGIGDQGR